MKRKAIIRLLILFLLIGVISCKRTDTGSVSSLENNLITSVAEIVGTQVDFTTAATDQAVAVEPFNGLSSAALVSCDSAHFNPRDTIGPFPGNHHHGWIFTVANHLIFAVPHIDSCIKVSVSSSSYPRQIVIEYIKGCSARHHDVSGKVIINLSDTITNAGAVQTIEYQDFYIDSIKVDFNASFKNLGKNTNGNWVIEKTYQQTITKGSDVAVRKNTETQEWTAGFETPDRSDNVYQLTGSGSITVNDSLKYSKVITKPLVIDASCDYITSGTIELVKGGVTSTIDYGDGTCDNVATVTTNGITEEINLHSIKFREGGHFNSTCPGFGKRHGGWH